MRRLFRGLLLLALIPFATAGTELAGWTPGVAREHCRSLAFLAVRRAEVKQLVYTQPARYREGAWTLKGFVRLAHAPNGMKSAPFVCTFTKSSDLFTIEPVSLATGP